MRRTLDEDQQRLVCENVEMAYQLAWKFGHTILGDSHEKSITIEDLRSEAVVGLTEAAMRYDSTLGVEFGTVAFIWCRKYVLRAVRKYGTPLSVPDNFTEGVELVHLDTSGDNNIDLADDEREEDKYVVLTQAMKMLSEKERKVINHLFGLDGSKPLSGAETARILGVVPGRVSQIKEHALSKMKEMLRK